MNQRVWVLGVLLFGLAGCAHQQTRLQAEDESEREKPPDVKTIGAASTIANGEAKTVSGVGLVIGLEGTGGGSPAGGYRSMLEHQLQQCQPPVDNIKEVLASPTTSMVLLSAQVPPGARKGDPIDIFVTLPRESKTTSLRGGQLVQAPLVDFDTAKNLSPGSKNVDQLLLGHKVVRAEGAVLAGFGDGDESVRLREGCIWGGGVLKVDRPLYLILNSDQQYSRLAQALADCINETFEGSSHSLGGDIAAAKTKAVVLLGVPTQYKLNLPRYLRVVRLIPYDLSPATRNAYRRHLEEQLLDPAHTVTAALRLEALGNDSQEILKRGLTSKHPLVRFCSAEALAYLNCPSGGEELGRVVKEQPALRAFALTALASLSEAVSHVELRKLLEEVSPETRYGAFRALRALDEHEDAIQGEQLNDSFWLHHVAPGSASMIHLLTFKRPEIVLFGEDAKLIPPFPILAGEFTITAGKHDERCTITRTSLHHGQTKKQCSLEVEEVLHILAEMGATYADVVEFLRRADHLQCLSCQVAVDALPQDTSVYELAKAGAGESELGKNHPEIIEAKSEFNATPTLFERGTRSPSAQ